MKNTPQEEVCIMKIAYFDCFSGISGDMILGAMLDLGLPEEELLGELKKLPVEGYHFHIAKERRGAISGTRVRIEIHHQPARHYDEIVNLIRSSGLDPLVQERSLAVFERLGKAEAQVHQIPLERVHFHEVGALDSILDVVGSVVAMHRLGIERVYASRIPTGRGFVETHHGTLPVPAPATAVLLEGAPVYDNGVERELVTPTGAAILTTFAEGYGPLPSMTLSATGYGVGSHPASDPPNLLRVMTGTSADDCPALLQKRLMVLETNIDDMNPEFYDYLFERLFGAGALEVNLMPVQMKKNRPGMLLRALIEPSLRESALEILFKETTTLGVRIQEVERVELPREIREVETSYGPVRVKLATLPGGERRAVPEYEDCKRAARECGAPIRKVYENAIRLAAREAEGDLG
jgi:uncharacterized protein (TIGR00299 family) protein